MKVLSSSSLLFLYQCFIGATAFERSDVGKSSLFDESRINKMCAENDVKQRFWFIKQFSCLNVWIDFYEQQSHRSLYDSCWLNYTQKAHPGKDAKKWFDFICRSISPAVVMNTVHHCFLKNVTEDGSKTSDQLTRRYTQCSGVNMKVKMQSTESKLEAFTLSDPEEREAEEIKRKSLCIEKPDANTTYHGLKSLKCFEKAYPDQGEMIKRCWSLLLAGQYPSSDNDWLKFYCADKHPYVSINLVEECVRNHRYKPLASWPEDCEGHEAFTLHSLGNYVKNSEEKIASSIHEDICIKSERVAINAFITGFALYPITKTIFAFNKNPVGLEYCYKNYLSISTLKSEEEYLKYFCSIPHSTWRTKNSELLSCVVRIYLPGEPVALTDQHPESRFYSQVYKIIEDSSYEEGMLEVDGE